ncbi:SGNH/GDSL hydrolase family protein [bacterium]|nr:SGNH/GDSL hydrolase family protein [bacterium]
MTATGEATNTPLTWLDVASLTIEGKGWTDTESFYDRFPARAKELVDPNVWHLAKQSAGIVVRFETDSNEIHVRWKLTLDRLALTHMPATGVSGVDLYAMNDGRARHLAVGFPVEAENEVQLARNLCGRMCEYALYLPLYNGVESVELGVCADSTIRKAGKHKKNIKPVVFYGSSIVQGACASRPGRAYPSIISRMLDIETINLGFSGSGRCEHEVSELLAQIDPSVYVIDCIPNMAVDTVDERIRYLLDTLITAPRTPVILIESPGLQKERICHDDPWNLLQKNAILKDVYQDCVDGWNGGMHYIEGSSLLGDDGEATVDNLHPNDLGFYRMANAIAPVIGDALK